MKQRQCRDVAHAASILQARADGQKLQSPALFCAEPHNDFCCSAVLLVLLVLLATLLLLPGLLLAATLLLAALLLLPRLLVWILIHFLPLQSFESAIRSLVVNGESQSAATAFVPDSTLKQCVRNPRDGCRVPLVKGRTDDGTLFASMAARGADSNSRADLALRRP